MMGWKSEPPTPNPTRAALTVARAAAQARVSALDLQLAELAQAETETRWRQFTRTPAYARCEAVAAAWVACGAPVRRSGAGGGFLGIPGDGE